MAGCPRLIALSEQLRGKTFDLTKDFYTCGRASNRDVYLNDPTISSHHCDFILRGNSYFICDRNSTNGTRVNNVPVVEQELQNSDILQVGGVELLFDCDDKSVTTVIRTQTGINLGQGDLDVSTVTRMKNFSPFAKDEKKEKQSQKFVLIVVSLLVVLILALLGWLIYIVKNAQNPSSSPQPERPAATAPVKPAPVKHVK